MGFDPDALAALGGSPRKSRPPSSLGYVTRIGVASGVAAAVCDLVVWLVARGLGWSLQADDQQVAALSVIFVCLLVAVLAALGAYVATRVTRRPGIWVALIGLVLLVASIQGLPPALVAMHVIAGAWIIGWLTAAVRGGSHVR